MVGAGLEISATKMKVNMVETAVTVFTTHTNSVQFNSPNPKFCLKGAVGVRQGGCRWTVDSSQNLKLQQFYQYET